MSTTKVTMERINEVEHHPNADRLDIVQVLGYKVIVGRGFYEVGDSAVYFPPDILLPEETVKNLGMEKYLKHAIFPGNLGKSQCRVSACRLRGLPSHGFLISKGELDEELEDYEFGHDLTDYFGAKKYIPPVRVGAGDAARENVNFPAYTNIENIQRYSKAIPEGTEVVITEKIHGTNVRMGLIVDDLPEGQKYQYAAGSHKVRRKEGSGLYWQFMTQNVKDLLRDLVGYDVVYPNVVLYGEIFGSGVQDLDYGQPEKSLRVFDIAIDGKYLDYDHMCGLCDPYQITTVPLLYRGPFSMEVVEEHTYGPTTFPDVRSKFKDREGCVVKPVKEAVDYRGNRLIFKSVSADYRNRKGAKDDE